MKVIKAPPAVPFRHPTFAYQLPAAPQPRGGKREHRDNPQECAPQIISDCVPHRPAGRPGRRTQPCRASGVVACTRSNRAACCEPICQLIAKFCFQLRGWRTSVGRPDNKRTFPKHSGRRQNASGLDVFGVTHFVRRRIVCGTKHAGWRVMRVVSLPAAANSLKDRSIGRDAVRAAEEPQVLRAGLIQKLRCESNIQHNEECRAPIQPRIGDGAKKTHECRCVEIRSRVPPKHVWRQSIRCAGSQHCPNR